MVTTTENNQRTTEDLNDWLPITASRKAKWWYSAFHNVTAMVGAGVLGLPLVLARLGWIAGITSIGIAWVVTLYNLWLLVHLHEAEQGKRFDRFTELGSYAFGEKLGFWLVMPQQVIVQVGSNIVYMVTGGKSLQKCLTLITPQAGLKRHYYIMMFAALHLVLSQVPNFNSLKIISLLAAIMSISYSFIASGASIFKGINHHKLVSHGLQAHTTVGKIFGIFTSLGVIAFAFAGHSVALEIQATIPSTPEKPSKKPMWKGVVVGYIIVALCYFPVAICGFWAFGNTVDDDVLLSLEHPNWLISLANFMVFVHVIGSYQVFAMPIFDKIEGALVLKCKYTPGRPLRLIARSIYVVFTGLVAIVLPFFGALLGFFGGLSFSTTSYIIPSAVWLKVHQPKAGSFHWFACWISILIGISITATAPIGGARDIILSWKDIKFFK